MLREPSLNLPLAPKDGSSDWLRNKAEVDFGSWSGLDETAPNKVGVGIFFKKFPDGSVRVVSLVPGSSAFKAGLILKDDMLINFEGEMVQNWKLQDLRMKLHGPPGTFVHMQFQRAQDQTYKINLMRGSPGFIAYQDKFGVANAEQVDKLLLQKRQEQKMNFLVEKSLKIEQAHFAEVQLKRKQVSLKESSLREELEQLQRQCFEEERVLKLRQDELQLLLEQGSRRSVFSGISKGLSGGS